MNLPLWLIPALPLGGFLVNGLVALAAGSRRAAKATAEWRAAHPGEHGHGHEVKLHARLLPRVGFSSPIRGAATSSRRSAALA